MEMENKYASRGVGGTALGLAIGALGLEAVRGGVGGILGGNGCNSEAVLRSRIAELETEVKLRDANIYTDSKILEVYRNLDARIGHVEHELCDQKVFNATQIGTISCIQGQVAQLFALTKTVIPNDSICPGWTTATTTTG